MTFQQWIESLVAERFGTKTKLAEAIGVSLTQIGRGADAGKYSVVNLLKLAKVAEADPSWVLQLAGKGDIALLIEDLYGKSTLTPEQRAWLRAFADVPEKLHRALLNLVIAASIGDGPPIERSAESEVVVPVRARAGRKAVRRR